MKEIGTAQAKQVMAASTIMPRSARTEPMRAPRSRAINAPAR
ncbi:hypothetical protein ACVII1_002840 [Bradyrhizobium elkanii]